VRAGKYKDESGKNVSWASVQKEYSIGASYSQTAENQFGKEFKAARDFTKKTGKEAGYHIYINPKNKLEITDMITAKGDGVISSMEHIEAMEKMDSKGKTAASGYRLIGRFHTHPLSDAVLGNDNPISPGDINGLLTIAKQGSMNGNTDLQGYFEIVDSGTRRYVATITDAGLANESTKGHNSMTWGKDVYSPAESTFSNAHPSAHLRWVVYNTLIGLVENKGICIENKGL
jgi:hypothetical protein